MSDNVVDFKGKETESEECSAMLLAQDFLDICLDAENPDDLLDILHNMCHTAMNYGRISEVVEEIEAKEDYLQFLLHSDSDE